MERGRNGQTSEDEIVSKDPDLVFEGLDVHPVQLEIWRRMSPAQRLDVAMQLTRELVTANFRHLRSLHPEWSHRDLMREWAALNYGSDLAEKVYGPP